ncbi:MAG: hypothetical protein IJ180_10735, partial [Bacteroidales bacterium]|nr:hypothetical protein [Bacteroidales bacterium]
KDFRKTIRDLDKIIAKYKQIIELNKQLNKPPTVSEILDIRKQREINKEIGRDRGLYNLAMHYPLIPMSNIRDFLKTRNRAGSIREGIEATKAYKKGIYGQDISNLIGLNANTNKEVEQKIRSIISKLQELEKVKQSLGGKNSFISGQQSQLNAELNSLKQRLSLSREQSRIDRARNEFRRRAEAQSRREVEQSRRLTLELERQLAISHQTRKSFGELGSLLKQYFSVYAIRSYAENMVKITAEFDMQRRALGSLIGDQAKAISIFNQIKQMALESPFTALELNKSAKQLAAYSIQAKDLVKTTKMLGDISSATGVEISRLILAYGQVKTAHYLRGQEVRQFTEAGVPLLEALARNFTVKEGKEITSDEVMQRISERGVKFTDVKDVLETMTEEGGRFYNFQYEIAQTTYGKIQKFQDALQQGWDRLGRDTSGVLNTVLDVGVKVAKDLSGYVKTLGIALGLWKAVGLVRKANLSILNKEERLMQDTLMARQIQQTTKDPAVASYYGNMAKEWEGQSKKLAKIRTQIRGVKIATAQANQSATMLGRGWNMVGKNIKLAGLGVKMFFVAFKSALISTGIGALLIVLGAIVGKIWSAHDAAKQLKNELSEIDTETLKKNASAEKRFKELAVEATNAADGTAKQEKALSKLNELYGDILPNELLRIEYLKQMNGQYDLLIERIKTYNKIQAIENKKSVIQGQDKYADTFRDMGEVLTDKQVPKTIEKAVLKEIGAQISAGIINNADDFKSTFIDLMKEEGHKVTKDEIKIPDEVQQYFAEIEELQKQQVKLQETLYSKKGYAGIQALDKYIKKQEEELQNIKTGNDLITQRDSAVESVANQMVKSLNVQIDKNNALKYLMGEMTAEEVLKTTKIEEGTQAYNQTLQTMDNMKSAFVGLWDGVDIFSERSKEVLDIWKDSYITIATMQTLLGAGKDKSNKTYLNLKQQRDTSKSYLNNVLSQEELQKYYGVSKEQVEDLLKVNSKEQAQSYRDKYKKMGPLSYAMSEFADMEAQFLEFSLENFTEEEKTKKGSAKGKSVFEKQKEAMTEWVAMWSKAKQDYENMQEMFAKDKSIEKMWEMWEEQFGHIQDN